MWLIKTDNLELEYRQRCPEGAYAILSHTWGSDTEELNFREFKAGGGREKLGFEKIRLCCEQAQQDGLQYAWVDTCCIDKDSSTELSEAINSMFAWYREAKICYVYLADIDHYDPLVSDTASRHFRNSRWFTRGWTLQELIAPRNVVFYTASWNVIGDKMQLAGEIQCTCGIDKGVLLDTTSFLDYSIAQRMSWASMRQTTRIEDGAYSLIGLFNVNLNLLYGEGSKAFLRLQQEVISQTDDETIFAWCEPSENGTGLLAPSANHFARCGNVFRAKTDRNFRERPPYQRLNRGLQIECQLLPYMMNTYAMPLNCEEMCEDGSFRQIVIAIGRTLKEDQYRRVPLHDAFYPERGLDFSEAMVSNIFVSDDGRGLDLAPNAGHLTLRFKSDFEIWKFPAIHTIGSLDHRTRVEARLSTGDLENGQVLNRSMSSRAPASRIHSPLLIHPEELKFGVLVAYETPSSQKSGFRCFLHFGFDLDFKPVCIVYHHMGLRVWGDDNSFIRRLVNWRRSKHRLAIYGGRMAKTDFVWLENIEKRLLGLSMTKILKPTMFRGNRLQGFQHEDVIKRWSFYRCDTVRVSMRPTGLDWDIEITQASKHGKKTDSSVCRSCLWTNFQMSLFVLLCVFCTSGGLLAGLFFSATFLDLSIGQAFVITLLITIVAWGPTSFYNVFLRPSNSRDLIIIDVDLPVQSRIVGSV